MRAHAVASVKKGGAMLSKSMHTSQHELSAAFSPCLPSHDHDHHRQEDRARHGWQHGLGFDCCLELAKQLNTHVILSSRNEQRVDEVAAKTKALTDPTSSIEGGIIDLAFVRNVANLILKRKLELFTVVCHGGVQRKTKYMTVDDFEETFDVNHLGHFLLVEMLREHTELITTMRCETHDPAGECQVLPPNVSDLEQLVRGYEPFDGNEVYPTSKLCGLLIAKEFVRRYPNGPRIWASTPGFTPDTDIFREDSCLRVFLHKWAIKFVFRLAGVTVS
ncbi:Protochlorophyllide oxidoreductase [Globisporangium polare]